MRNQRLLVGIAGGASVSFLLLGAAQVVSAQVVTTPVSTVIVEDPQFLFSILAGTILAFAFQLILTQFSIAVGVTSIGDLTDNSDSDDGWDLRRLPASLGMWALLTASISLFAASWLAVVLSGTGEFMSAVVLGLVIWGLFYISMTLVESTALSSLVGYLISTATISLKSLSSLGSGVISKSEASRIAESSARVAAAVRDEILGTPEVRETQKALKKYFKEAQIPSVNVNKIKKELLDLLENVEIRATVTEEEGPEHEKTLVAALSGNSKGNNAYQMVQKAKGVIDEVKDEYNSNKPRSEKVIDSTLRLAGFTPEQAVEHRKEVEEFLASTGNEELDPQRIKEQLDLLFTDPKEGYEQIKAHFSGMSRDSLNALVSKYTNVSLDEANSVMQNMARAATDAYEGAKAELKSAGTGVKETIRGYLDGLDRPELSYDQIYHDIEEIIADPMATPEVLSNRAQALNRDTFTAVLASREGVSEEDAERFLQRIESLRDDLSLKAEQMKNEIARRLEDARVKTLEIAEAGRKQVASAAWWVFATAAASAIASVAGSWMAVQSLI